MANIYLITGIMICALFIYAGNVGWNIFSNDSASSSKPKGPGQYHK